MSKSREACFNLCQNPGRLVLEDAASAPRAIASATGDSPQGSCISCVGDVVVIKTACCICILERFTDHTLDVEIVAF